MSIQLRTEIEIGATAERVWDILTDFAAYPAWNPFIPRLDGSVAVGARLDARLQPPGGHGTRQGFKAMNRALKTRRTTHVDRLGSSKLER